jgi:hypothetical protein
VEKQKRENTSCTYEGDSSLTYLGIINDSPGGGEKISYVAGTWWWWWCWSHNLICKKDAELDPDMARSAD